MKERLAVSLALILAVSPAAASQSAMSQLEHARNLSLQAAMSGPETAARWTAGSAFEQSRALGLGPTAVGEEVMVPLGSGAPDVARTAPGAPSVGASGNVTPYQDKVNDSKKKTDKSKMLKILGAAAIAAGVAMLAAGKKLMQKGELSIAIGKALEAKGTMTVANAASAGPLGMQMAALGKMMIFNGKAKQAEGTAMKNMGKALMVAGAAAIALGVAMLALSQKMADDAKKNAKDIKQDYGQNGQAGIIRDCADQAVQGQGCVAERNTGMSMQNGGPIL